MKTTIKVPWPQPKDSVFSAFKWDVHLLSTYETIFKSLQSKKEYSNLTFKYGSKVLPNEEKSFGVPEFINRNKQLYEIFVEGIESSDIFVADITGQNPNVMLELGIAMKLNKNILILKQKNEDEKFPFDIQGVHIQEYATVKELEKHIFEFIEMFSKIRNQTFDDYLQDHYVKVDKIELATGPGGATFTTDPRLPSKIRNLRIRFSFEFLDHVSKQDWIGVHLRTQGPGRDNSELIYSRVNDQLEVLPWPTNNPPAKADPVQSVGNNRLEITLLENQLSATSKSKVLPDYRVFADGFGSILFYLQAHTPEEELKNHSLKVQLTNIEVINLDTTAQI